MGRFLAILAALGVAACSVVGMSETPQPPHAVVERLTEAVEVRRYAPRVAVETVMGEGGRDAAFRRLFDYIQGAHAAADEIATAAPVAERRGGAEIAMTAPVAVAREGSGGTMRFFLPEEFEADTAPRPSDPRVRLVDLPEQSFAVLRYSGGRSAEAAADAQARLLEALEPSRWRPAGAPVSWFYDPPWTLPPFRRNEAAVPVEAAG